MMTSQMLALFASSFIVAALAVEGVRRVALRRQLLDIPNSRSSHTTPTPRGGGIIIVVVLLVGWGLSIDAGDISLIALLASTIIVASVSGIDDLRPLTARTRFASQILAVAVLLGLVGPWDQVAVPWLGLVPLDVWGGILGSLLIAVWSVGLANAYNFMDGIDGIAATQAIVAGMAWAVVGVAFGVMPLALSGVLITGTSAGFLIHNWAPARIFMGDVGSASLGFVFSALAVVAVVHLEGAEGARVPLAGLLFVWPFVFDAVFTVLRRMRAGENVFEAHRSHLYQRMVIAGWSHRVVTSLYAGLAVCAATSGLIWVVFGAPAAAIVGLIAVPICLLVAIHFAEQVRSSDVL